MRFEAQSFRVSTVHSCLFSLSVSLETRFPQASNTSMLKTDSHRVASSSGSEGRARPNTLGFDNWVPESLVVDCALGC